jgi:hypothetical protein
MPENDKPQDFAEAVSLRDLFADLEELSKDGVVDRLAPKEDRLEDALGALVECLDLLRGLAGKIENLLGETQRLRNDAAECLAKTALLVRLARRWLTGGAVLAAVLVLAAFFFGHA